MYQVLASPVDYRYAVCIFTSQDFDKCTSLASVCFQSSSLACFKVVDSDDNVLVSFIRK